MAFRSSASATGTGTGTITATPAGVAAHDYLGGWWLADGSATPTLTPPVGWTQRASIHVTLDGSTQFYADKDDATGSDAFGFADNAAGNNKALITAAWSGRNNSAPRSATPVTTGNSTSNTTPISATITGITAVSGDDIGIGLGTDETLSSRWTESLITNYTQQVNGVALDFVSGAGLQTRDNVSAGATGNFATTITRNSGTGNSGYCGIVVAIAAAAAGGAIRLLFPSPMDGVGSGGVFRGNRLQ